MKVVILSGVPGCGKSRYAASVAGRIIVSADFHLPKNPLPEDFGIAHRQCFRDFDDALRGSKDIVVDNTNLTAAEIAPYYTAAESLNIAARVEVRRIHRDLETCWKEQQHHVPFDVWITMAANFKARNVMPWWNVYEQRT